MIRTILVALILATVPLLAQAQTSKSPGAEHKWSVGTGIGFVSSVGSGSNSQSGFLWQLDGQYRLTDAFSAGLFLQVAPISGVNFGTFGTQGGGTLVSFAGDARYHFDLSSQSNDVVRKLTPYAGLGMGFTHFGFTQPFLQDQTAFLFSMIFGIEYDLNEHIALTSDMRFNILGGTSAIPVTAFYTIPQDHFYYSWQVAGIRYRF